MKITEQKLKQIIKEELFSEARSWKSSWRDNKKGVRLPKKPDLYPKNELNIKTAQTIFKYFHLSKIRLGKETFVFNPRIPSSPGWWEDDFTKRISLAPTIAQAIEALQDSGDFHVYAGDVKKDDTDNIETISLKAHFPKCPKSKKNPYSDDFDIIAWLLSLSDDELSPMFRKLGVEKQHYSLFRSAVGASAAQAKSWEDDFGPPQKSEMAKEIEKAYAKDPKQGRLLKSLYHKADNLMDITSRGPKKLPQPFRDMFKMCVPDARETNEFWVTKDVELIYLGQHKAGDTFVELSDSAKIYLGALFNKKK